MTDENENPTTIATDQKAAKASHGNLKKAACATALASLLAVGGVMAYLTSTDAAENRFSLAEKIEIDVVEPSWVEADASGMLPNMTVAKDPAVKNVSDVEGWIAMTIEVPTKSIQLVGESAAANHELVEYTINNGWTETGSATYDASTGMTTHTYLYGNKLPAGATTDSLFDDITLVNMIEGQIPNAELQQSLNVYGYAIQSHGFADVEAAWAAYRAQNA